MADLQDNTTLKAGCNQFDTPVDMAYLIRQSNLIEDVDNPKEDKQSMVAWNYLKGRVGINESVIRTVHDIITKNLLPRRDRGQFRLQNVYIGGKPAMNHLFIENALTAWRADMLDMTPKDAHIRFEKIHPFIDGNGRTGRMLMWWHELKLGQQPTLILNSKKGDYYEWFR